MHLKVRGEAVSRGGRAPAGYALFVLIASAATCATTANARADDAATLQRLEAKIQQLEDRHETEIKSLQAEIRRLRKEKPAAAVATRPAGAQSATSRSTTEQAASSPLLPVGLPVGLPK